MRLMIWSAILLFPLLTACGSDNTATRSNSFLPLTSIEVSSTSAQIANLTSAQLTAVGNFSGQFTRDITTEVAWSSSDPGVATIDNQAGSEGRVTAVSPGTVTLTASLDGVTADFVLAVSSATITTLSLSPSLPSVPKGLDQQFSATGDFSDGSQQDLTTDATWTSADPTVASISNTRGSEGLATAVLEGITQITGTFDGLATSTTLTVTAAALQSLTISPADGAMVSLSNRSFKANGSFSDGTSRDVTSSVTWNTADSTVASVAPDGVVTALMSGQTTIDAALGGVSTATGLTVNGGDLQGISLSTASSLTLAAGTSAELTATGLFSNNTSRDITQFVTWDSDNPSVATISNVSGLQGRLSALASGTATISATYGTLAPVSTSLNVDTAVLNSLDVTPAAPTIFTGTTQAFTVTGVYSGRTQDLTLDATWTSSDSGVAGIGNVDPEKGIASGIAAGQSTISASFGGVADGVATLDVLTETLQSISISPITVSLSPGAVVQLAVTATYIGGATQDVTGDVAWSSPDESLAEFQYPVRFPGLLTGVSAGSVDVQADFGGQTATLTVDIQ